MKALIFFLFLALTQATTSEEFAAEAEMTIDEAIELVSGILTGLNVKGDVDNLKSCLQEVPLVVAKIKQFIEAIKLLDWKDLDKVFEFFSKLFDTLKELFQALKPCFKTPQDIEKILKKIGNIDPTKLLAKIMAKIWIIFTTITDCLKKFEKHLYNEAGKDIGDVLYLIFLEDSFGSDVSGNGFVDFVRGLLEGIGVGKDIEELLKCVKGEGEAILKKIKEAIELLKHISLKHLGNLIKGLKALFGAILEIFNMVLVCGPKCEIIIKLIKAIKNCNILSLVYHLIRHAPSFVKDIIQCIAAFAKKDFRAAGKAIGDMIKKLFLGAQTDEEDAGNLFLDFFKGLFVGIGEQGSVKLLEECMKNFEILYVEMIKALEMIKTLDIHKIIEGVKLLIEIFKHIGYAAEPCMKGLHAFDKLIEALKNFDLIKIITKIMKDPTAYIKMIEAIFDAFAKGNFYDAGKNMGSFLKALFID